MTTKLEAVGPVQRGFGPFPARGTSHSSSTSHDRREANESPVTYSPSRAPFPSVADATAPERSLLPRSGATCLELFRSGLDTFEIARVKGYSEADVYNLMHSQRGKVSYPFKTAVR